MRSELYLLSGAAVGMAAAVILIFAQPGETNISSSSGAAKTFTAELDRSTTMSMEHAMAPVARPGESGPEAVLEEREVRVILPSPYAGSSARGSL